MSLHNRENSEKLSASWIHQEFECLDMGDKRLNKRLLSVAEALEAHPGSLINAACGDWASVKAAYRLFDNEKVSPEKILAPHFERTVERMYEHRRVFAIQDTTYLNYTDHPSTEGLGSIGTSSQRLQGIVKHSTFVVNGSGLPLGCLTDKMWVRETPAQKSPKSRLLKEKESYKWIEALSALRSEALEAVEVNREADIYEFFVEAQDLSFVIRAAQDRVVDEDVGKLRDLVKSQPSAGEITVQVPVRGSEPAREATLSVYFTAAKLRPPHRSQASRSQELPAVDIYVVWVIETDPPEDGDAFRLASDNKCASFGLHGCG